MNHTHAGTPPPQIRAARPEDEPAIRALLEAASLPTVELGRWLERFVVAERGGELVGAAGLEVHGADGLLRSVVVSEAERGGGVGGALTAGVLAEARAAGLRRVYLLTTTAEGYFPRLGFRRITREEASSDVRESVEFREACPASAAVMMLELRSS
jgi:amino-acid N-acetyltransferase